MIEQSVSRYLAQFQLLTFMLMDFYIFIYFNCVLKSQHVRDTYWIELMKYLFEIFVFMINDGAGD